MQPGISRKALLSHIAKICATSVADDRCTGDEAICKCHLSIVTQHQVQACFELSEDTSQTHEAAQAALEATKHEKLSATADPAPAHVQVICFRLLGCVSMRSCGFEPEVPLLRDARPLQPLECSHLHHRRTSGLGWRQQQHRRSCRTSSCAGGDSTDGLQTSEGWIAAHRQRKDWTIGPRLELSREAAVQMQLQVRYIQRATFVSL